MDRWWYALERSCWSECISLKGLFMFYQHRDQLSVDGWRTVIYEQLNPRRLAGTLEDLVTQKLLQRKAATAIEESILVLTKADGSWRREEEAYAA